MTTHPPTDTGAIGAEGSVLEGLLARVEAATGPDRALDWAIWGALQGVTLNATGEYRGALKYPDWVIGDWRGTASLDAALALCERVLPGWAPAIRKDPRPAFEGLWHAFVARNGSGREQHAEWGSTPALALLAAMLRALLAQAPSPATTPTGVLAQTEEQ